MHGRMRHRTSHGMQAMRAPLSQRRVSELMRSISHDLLAMTALSASIDDGAMWVHMRSPHVIIIRYTPTALSVNVINESL